MKGLVERLKGKPFRIVGINSDRDLEKTKHLIGDHGISWPNVLDGGTDGPVSSAWKVQSWPTFYLLDRSGMIRFAGDELRSVAPVQDKLGGVRIVSVMDEDIDKLLEEPGK